MILTYGSISLWLTVVWGVKRHRFCGWILTYGSISVWLTVVWGVKRHRVCGWILRLRKTLL